MKKLLETSLGNGSETAFVFNGQRVLDTGELPKILERECNPYTTKDDEGVIVYMSKREYDLLNKK